MISDDGTVEFTFRAVEAIRRTTAALVRPYDVLGTVTQLLTAECRALGADAAGVTMRRAGGEHLELLAATSHRAEELELYQAQKDQGPCFDAVELGVRVSCSGRSELTSRWPVVAPAFDRAGIAAVDATPLHWQGLVIGALNLFWVSEQRRPSRFQPIASAFADLATLAIVHSGAVSATDVIDRTQAALDSRTVIEQAKGVLAARNGLSMEASYLALVDLAAEDGRSLGAVATEVVEGAANP